MKLFQSLVEKYNSARSDNHFGEIFSGSILVFSAKIFATLLGLVTSVIVARFYGDEVLGVLALVNSFFVVVTIFTLFGTNTSILRLIPQHRVKYSLRAAFEVYKKSATLICVFSIFMGVLLFFGAGFISEIVFGRPDLKFLFQMAAIVVLFKSFQIFSLQVLRAINEINLFALIQVIFQFLFLSLVLISPYIIAVKYSPVYLQYVTIIIIAVFGLLLIQNSFRKNIKENDKTVNISYKEILTISFPMFLTSSMMIIMGQMATLIIGIFRPEEEVGYYSVAFRIATLTIFVLQAINTVAAPKFSELYSQNKIDQLFYVAKKSTKLIFYSIFPILLVFAFFGKWIIVGLYGENFEISYTLLLIISIGMLISAMSGSVGYFLNMTGNEKAVRNIAIISLILSLLLNIVLITLFGLVGVAIATTFVLSFRNIALTIVVQRKFGRNFSFISKSY